MPATYYSRGTHGTRTDVVEIYDTEHLAPQAEVVIPPKRATNARRARARRAVRRRSLRRHLQLDHRHLAQHRRRRRTARFAGEIATPGLQPRLPDRAAPLPVALRRRRGVHPDPRRRRQRGEPRPEQAVLRSEGRSGDREGGARRRSVAVRLLRRHRASGRRHRAGAGLRPDRGRCSSDADKSESWRIGGIAAPRRAPRQRPPLRPRCTAAAPTPTRIRARRCGSSTSPRSAASRASRWSIPASPSTDSRSAAGGHRSAASSTG